MEEQVLEINESAAKSYYMFSNLSFCNDSGAEGQKAKGFFDAKLSTKDVSKSWYSFCGSLSHTMYVLGAARKRGNGSENY